MFKIWREQRVLVTGGASFIGSHLVDALILAGARVRVVDDLSSGRLDNILGHVASGTVEFVEADLRHPGVATKAVEGMETVFHLAADHGGRGYVDLHQADCSSNLVLDGVVFRACHLGGVSKVVYASSGCVYPMYRQEDPSEEVYLDEDAVGPPYQPDNVYGWAKLMGELTLQAYNREYGMNSVSCRYFTVYGERGVENHAVIALIARAVIGQDPYEVWGTGQQIRNWTHVSDIVRGTMLAAEHIHDGSAVNLGTMERIRLIDAVRQVMDYTGFHPSIVFRTDMPTGPYNRVADNALARRLLGWETGIDFTDGLRRTIDWYIENRDLYVVARDFERLLTERR